MRNHKDHFGRTTISLLAFLSHRFNPWILEIFRITSRGEEGGHFLETSNGICVYWGRLLFWFPSKKLEYLEWSIIIIYPLWHRVWGKPSDVISMYTKCVPSSDFERFVEFKLFTSHQRIVHLLLSSESVYEKNRCDQSGWIIYNTHLN